ncbi:BAG family molecular chaperone regulator 1 isoform X1 [Protobothrops mucrosquamatus]|uniref:BAG family molecular chaperone regulator 1 isoform X1 n=1 Tax=Protobothrops mucrosquamatus TaxID=103944 RepID=UPI0007758E8A|nr:BAG family molecular chaperone regulator 1 isoform X1 [Protobothrops mucrosquamatus]
MAGPYEKSAVIVTVTYGNEKHNLQVDSQEDSQPTVYDLALLTEQVTGVPVSFQKLIYKGKSLKEMEQPLSTLGVKNGCKVMLIGKRNSPEEETELKKLKVLEKAVEQLAKKIDEVNKELREIQKDFLAKNNQTEALSQLDKRIKGIAEQFMKILEQIDAIPSEKALKPNYAGWLGVMREKLLAGGGWYINKEGTPSLVLFCKSMILPDNFNDSKQKKKGLVKKIQAFLAQCDTVEGNISQEMDKLHSKNMVLAE